MLYSEIKRETLSHLNQYSIAGAQIAPSYNNQADYLNRIPLLINEGLVNIRTLVKPDPVVYQLTEGEEYGDMVRYELPEDFWNLKTGGVSAVINGKFTRTNNYKLQGKKFILVPGSEKGSYTVEYYKYPEKLPLNPKEDFDLQEDLEVIQTATYYAAANLILHDDPTTYSLLYNDYESRLSRISPGIRAEVDTVQDEYSFFSGW